MTWCLLSRNDTQRYLRCTFLQLVVYDHFLIPIALKKNPFTDNFPSLLRLQHN